jgi:hypothetical protein|tara:strand:+ start:1917 stop:2879 length:963 start_codon:yes stop_codon:yes gene_type:complete
MGSRFIFALFLCAGIGVCPIHTNSQDGHKIDLRHLVAPPFATTNTPAPTPTVGQSDRKRIVQRRLQYRQRRAALRHVTRLRRFAHIDFDAISKAYIAKKKSLHLIVSNQRMRQQQIALAKRRAITEVKNLAALVRERFEAEERAMAEAIRKLRKKNPDYADQALRRAVAVTEKSAGVTIVETENLPLLSKTVDLSYIDPIRRNNQHTKLPAKHTSPIGPTMNTQPEEKLAIPFLEPHNPASLKGALELEALIAYKKQKALERAKQAKQQAAVSLVSASKLEKTQKLRELVELYVMEKISPREYYHRRELILGTSTSQDKE